MPSNHDIFDESGPIHLTSSNWNCPNYQRSAAASLVKGVYVMERDRQKKRYGNKARAPCWYQHFNFTPHQILVDDNDSSIFGVVYKFTLLDPLSNFAFDPCWLNAPIFVLAFRGTLLGKKTGLRGVQLDLGIVKNGLENENRVKDGYQALEKLVSIYGHQRIWLAGQSLGAAIAILVGKHMAKLNLKSFLFNPPYVLAPIEWIKNTRIKNGIRIAHIFLKAGVASVLRHGKSINNCVESLTLWEPQLYVNRADIICCEYIGYFEHRKVMENFGAKDVEIIAMQYSALDLFLNFSGNQSEPLHLFPSAILNVNQSHSSYHFEAHRLCQWWQPDLNLDSTVYHYSN